MGAIFGLTSAVIGILPDLIKLGVDVADLWQNTRRVIDENRIPGDADWDALDKRVNDLRAELHRDPS
jgi:hypothetical protein